MLRSFPIDDPLNEEILETLNQVRGKFKTVVALADELIRQGKSFDFAFAPGATHGWSRDPAYGRFLFGKLFEHFERYLSPPTPEPSPSSGR